MSINKLICISLALALVTGVAVAQDQSKEESGTVIKHVPVKSTSAASGKEMYESYCAVCHGKDGVEQKQRWQVSQPEGFHVDSRRC